MRVLATILLCLYLPVPPIMLWLHGPIGIWRRMGRWSYAIHTPIYLSLVASVALTHHWWPLFAWNWPLELRVAGALSVIFAFALFAITYREIDSWTAMAGPQITGDTGRTLLTSGIYGVIRHPRYVVLLLGSFGNFLLTGYPLILAAFVFIAVCTPIVAHIEDAELAAHFGGSFRDYQRRVPGWLPMR